MAKEILGYAERVQYSVYECYLKRNKYLELLEKIKKIINEQEDNVRVYSLPKDQIQNVTVFGNVNLVEDRNYYIVDK